MPTYTLPQLPYDCAALEPHYSARALELHHDRHHAAYVKGANTTLEKLAEARGKGDFAAINQLQKNLAFHLSGHVLHSLSWKNLTPEGGGPPDGELSAAIKEFFGSFDGFKEQLIEAAMNIQGSGWGALAWEALGKRLVVEQVYDHQGNIGNGTVPLLVLDMWEHAYYLQYQSVTGMFATESDASDSWEQTKEPRPVLRRSHRRGCRAFQRPPLAPPIVRVDSDWVSRGASRRRDRRASAPSRSR